jgi:hypothetical protein
MTHPGLRFKRMFHERMRAARVALSLKSIREKRNDHFEFHRDRSLAQMRRGHDVHDQHQREKAADCDN